MVKKTDATDYTFCISRLAGRIGECYVGRIKYFEYEIRQYLRQGLSVDIHVKPT